MIHAFKEFLYQNGIVKPTHLPGYTVSVGNVTFGGTGKSPFVRLLAERALAKGLRVAVLSRGYKRKARDLRIVLSNAPLPGPQDIGDEPWMLKHSLPGITLLVHKDRARMALRHWQDIGSPQLVILDDGFQHWRVFRDLDIVMVDAFAYMHGRKWFAAREPWSALSRAEMVVVNRVDAISADELATAMQDFRLQATLRKRVPWKPAERKPVSFYSAFYRVNSYEKGETQARVADPKNKSYLLVSGIAKPESFRYTVHKEGLKVVEEIYFSDHHVLSEKEERGILQRLKAKPNLELLVNEKDWARWHPFFLRHKLSVTILKVDLAFTDEDLLNERIEEILACSISR